MKKRDLSKLVLLGLANGLLMTAPSSPEAVQASDYDFSEALAASKAACKGPKGCPGVVAQRDAPKQHAPIPPPTDNNAKDTNKGSTDSEEYGDDDGNLGYHLYTEDELMLELNQEGLKLYNSLSKEGKELALKVASVRCNGSNECKGLNACKTEENDCAGKGDCKGKGKCAIADKNLAVKLVADKMAKQRSNAMNK